MVYEGDEEMAQEGVKWMEERREKAMEEREPDENDDDEEFSSDEEDENSESESEDENDSTNSKHERKQKYKRRVSSPPYTIKLIDFAHTRFVPGQGPDEGVLLGLHTFLALIEGRIEEIKLMMKGNDNPSVEA